MSTYKLRAGFLVSMSVSKVTVRWTPQYKLACWKLAITVAISSETEPPVSNLTKYGWNAGIEIHAGNPIPPADKGEVQLKTEKSLDTCRSCVLRNGPIRPTCGLEETLHQGFDKCLAIYCIQLQWWVQPIEGMQHWGNME